MNIQKITEELKLKYPNKTVINNGLGEIVCEVKPGSEDSTESIAVAVIDSTKPHYHETITETYKVIKGKLDLYIDQNKISLSEGDIYVIEPKHVHYATGNETWIECTSHPAWTFEDHLFPTKQL
jgi:mannose-6-phosphate isomerase-like protein (cupin superfamily)